jgi:hypothetical protein
MLVVTGSEIVIEVAVGDGLSTAEMAVSMPVKQEGCIV